jgi:transcriptional regulator with XRE-family HTH domain
MGLRIWPMPPRKRPASGFGKRLLALRKDRGLTQVELAKLTNSSQRAISYYENEAGFPPTTAVVALAEALHVSTDELLGLEPRRPGILEADPELRRAWKKFQLFVSLPERDRRAVMRLISSLASAHQVTHSNSQKSITEAAHG